MLFLRENRSNWLLYALLLAALSFASFGSLLTHPFSTDDFAYLSDATALRQDPAHLLSDEQALPGRPVVSIVFLLTHIVAGSSPAPYHLLLIVLHLAASILLAFSFRRLGASLELSMLGGLLFSINVAHFRAVQWISCLAYPLVLLFSLTAILLFKQYLDGRRRRWLLAACGLIGLAILTHASALITALFCAYLAWRRGLGLRAIALATGPLGAVAFLGSGLLYWLYPHAPQSKELLLTPEPMLLLRNLCEALSRCFTTAHWLVSYETAPWEWLAGLLIGASFALLLVRKVFPAADWAVWSLLALLPFIFRQEHDASRYLYLATAGTSFLLAWLIGMLMRHLQQWWTPALGRLGGGVLVAVLTVTSWVCLQRAESISLYYASRTYVAQGDQQTSLALLKRAIAHDPRRIPPDAYMRLAVTGFLFGEPSQEILQTGLAIHPSSPELHVVLGAAAFLERDTQQREWGDRQVRTALERSANRSQLQNQAALAFHHIGLYHNDTGQATLAVPAFERALLLQPDYALALAGLGQAYSMQQQKQKALTAYQNAVHLSPHLARAQQELALLLMQEGDYLGATTALQSAVAADSTNSTSWYMLAQALRIVGDVEAARQAVLRAIAGNPAQPYYWREYCRIADLYCSRDQLDQALAMYEDVIDAIPTYAKAHFNLGLIHYTEGRYIEAVAALRKAVALSPDDTRARQALEQASKSLLQTAVFPDRIPQPTRGAVSLRN
jgi:tetratricopeptide (TPR) repeat protein